MYKIKLKSPYGKTAVFNCMFNLKPTDEANDLLFVLRMLAEDFSDLKDLLDENLDAGNSYENMSLFINKYNNWLEDKKKTIVENLSNEKKRASTSLIKYMMHLIYNRAVSDPDKLNQYEPFSPQVYGETSFDLVDQMLSKVKLKETDVFMDLGSGVGNVVLHVAASSSCKYCYGFEKADWPALYASKMENEFRFWMNFFGRTYSQFKLYKGDFLSDEEFVDVECNNNSNEMDSTSNSTNVGCNSIEIKSKTTKRVTMNNFVKDLINEANLIFVNNYAFGAEVDHQLKLRFCNMLEGAMIVSSKPFCSLNFRINSRNLNDIGTILNINEFEPLNGHVSWTDKPINYYFHKIDRTLLEKYFERLKNPNKSKEDHETSSEWDAKHNKLGKSNSSALVCSTSSPSPSSSSSSPSASSYSTTSPSSSSSLSSPSSQNTKSKTKSRTRSVSKGRINENRSRSRPSRNATKNKKRKKQIAEART